MRPFRTKINDTDTNFACGVSGLDSVIDQKHLRYKLYVVTYA